MEITTAKEALKITRDFKKIDTKDGILTELFREIRAAALDGNRKVQLSQDYIEKYYDRKVLQEAVAALNDYGYITNMRYVPESQDNSFLCINLKLDALRINW